MATTSAGREQTGLLLTAGFVLAASLRDVYFARTLQAQSPLDVAAVAFSLCTLVFLAVALVGHRAEVVALGRWPRELTAINATSALAWIAFFYALHVLEPALVQVVWAGSGPLTISLLERLGVARVSPVTLAAAERWCQIGVGVAIALAIAVALLGLSATGAAGSAAGGVGLALISGAAISVNTLLCKRLNERGVSAAPLLSVRFVGVVVVALAFGPFVGTRPSLWSSPALLPVALAALGLIVLPLYLNQHGIALASPMTVRVVHAAGPVLVFALQLAEGRLPASPWSLAAIALYAICAALAAIARQWEVAADRRRERAAAACGRIRAS